MSDTDLARITPPLTEVARPYWEACRREELYVQFCPDCERFQFYPRTTCSNCGSDAPEWQQVSGRGKVASFTVVRRGISPAYEAPYVVALIELEEGPVMMSNLVDCDPETVEVGAAVAVRFEAWGADHVLPVFTPVA